MSECIINTFYIDDKYIRERWAEKLLFYNDIPRLANAILYNMLQLIPRLFPLWPLHPLAVL